MKVKRKPVHKSKLKIFSSVLDDITIEHMRTKNNAAPTIIQKVPSKEKKIKQRNKKIPVCVKVNCDVIEITPVIRRSARKELKTSKNRASRVIVLYSRIYVNKPNTVCFIILI